MQYFHLSLYDVVSRSEITPCNKIDEPLMVYRFTVDSEIFARILFSRKALKDILVMWKISRLRQDLSLSINDREILPFREGFIFTKLRICKVLRK